VPAYRRVRDPHRKGGEVNIARTIGRIAAVLATVSALTALAGVAQAGTSRPPSMSKAEYRSAAAVAAWSATYRAKEKEFREQLAARSSQTSLPPPAAIQAWSDSYRAMEDVYQQQQLAQAERQAAAFNVDDAVIGGGIVLAVGALAAAGFYVLRGRRLEPTPS
jgi:hypothetical protein